MGCGCKKARTNPVLPRSPLAKTFSAEDAAAMIASGAVTSYDVFDSEGSIVASFTNPVSARAESRRISGTVVPRGSGIPATLTDEAEKEPSNG